jgi:hypothetical protein
MVEQYNPLNTLKLSTHAESVITKYSKSKKSKSNPILYVKEHLSHDGYDRYGPESNLWDLYVYTKNNKTDEIIILNYHWEDWFYHGGNSYRGYGKNPYEIINKTNWQYDELIKVIGNS